MKLLFLSGARSRAAGGVFEVERWLAQTLRSRHGLDIEAAGYRDRSSDRDNQDWIPIPVHCFDRIGPQAFGYSPGLGRWMKTSDHDILHLHNLWMFTSVATLNWQRRLHRPYVVSPHGMLDPWAVRNSGWKKRVARIFYEQRMLERAAVVHAFHEKDVADFRRFGLRNPVAVIPNGVELPEPSPHPEPRNRTILFLGRLHPKKGVAELIEAWHAVPIQRRSEWRLAIAGWDEGSYIPKLKEQVAKYDLDQSIAFLGPIFGEEKLKLFRTAACFILPSFSEGLPMSVLEAWANRMPVIMTDHCNLPSGFSAQAALRITTSPADIAIGLNEFMTMSDAARANLGENGRRLVESNFTWDFVADRFASVYRWILVGGPRPTCVEYFN